MEACGEEVQLKLLGAIESPFALRVRIALALKGIDYEFIEEPDVFQNKSQLLLQSNPVHKKIPVLIHNGKPICESMIILQYIEDAWDTKEPNLVPKAPYDRAIARFWVAFVDDKLVPCLRGVFFGEGEQQQKAAVESVANFLLMEETLRTNQCFSGKPYFGGEEIGLIDIAVGSMWPIIKAIQKGTDTDLVDSEKMPLLCGWMDGFLEAIGMKEVLPDSAKLLEFVCNTRARFTSPTAAN